MGNMKFRHDSESEDADRSCASESGGFRCWESESAPDKTAFWLLALHEQVFVMM